MLGRDEATLVGQWLPELAHPLDRSALKRMLAAAQGGKLPERQEMRFVRPHKGEITTGFNAAPGEDEQLVICILRDLSGEKALRPQMLHTERMASMGQIASMVAHELNNSLAGAIGCLELLSDAEVQERQELIQTALSELHRSAKIVTEIKGYARNDEDMNDRVEMGDVIRSLQNLMRYHQPQGQRFELRVELAQDLPRVRGNANQLLQALVNLVRNAYDAVADLPEDQRTVEVRVRAMRDTVEIEVLDQGSGIPEQMQAKLFQPFYSTKPKGNGTGLGLTVVQSIASSHGGRVEADTSRAGGALFRMTLPADCSSDERLKAEAVQEGRTLDVLRGKRVLIADDEKTIRRIFARLGDRYEAEVTLATNAEEAIEHLQDQRFDLIFLDIRMPKGGGPAVFNWLQKNRPDLSQRCVFISGEFSSEMNQIVGRDYAQTLRKPFALADLDVAARKVLSEKKP